MLRIANLCGPIRKATMSEYPVPVRGCSLKGNETTRKRTRHFLVRRPCTLSELHMLYDHEA